MNHKSNRFVSEKNFDIVIDYLPVSAIMLCIAH